MIVSSEGWDIFISYARLDVEAVVPIQKALEALGVQVWRDETELETFEAITRGVRDGVAHSRVLLAYYSERYPNRRACQWELTAAFLAAQRHGDPRERVLVINAARSCDGGLRVDHVQPVQLRDAVFAAAPEQGDIAAVTALATRIGEHLKGISGSLGRSQTLLSRSFGSRPISSPSFVGRLGELWELHSALTAGEAVQITAAHEGGAVALTGVAGGGKSLLAEEYVLRFAAAWPGGVFWLSAADAEGDLENWRDSQMRTMAAQLQMPIENRSALEIHADVRAYFETTELPCLWVVDDLPAGLDAAQIRAWFAPHARAATLVTCKTREYSNMTREVRLGGLSTSDGNALLTAGRLPSTTEEEGAAGEIVEALAGHPLALAICGADLAVEAGLRTFAEYRDALADPSRDALELAAEIADELPTAHEPNIAVTLVRSIELLGESGRDLLRIAAGLAVAPIPNQLVVTTIELADQVSPSEALQRVKRAIREVDRHCLAEVGDLLGETRVVHPLVSRTMRFRDGDLERAAQLQAAVSTPLASMIDALLQPGVPDLDLQGLIAHGRALQLSAGPVSAIGRIADSLAHYDFTRGDYAAARQGQEIILAIRREILGPDHVGTITAEMHLARTLRALGDLGAATELQEHVLQVYRGTLGDGDMQTALAMNELAVTLAAAGQVAKAECLQRTALDVVNVGLGVDATEALILLGNLAATFRELGDSATAQVLEEQVLDARIQLAGDDDPFTLLSMNNLAGTLQARGDYVGAEQLQERVIEGRRRVLGADHRDTLVAIGNLSGILFDRGDFARALELQEELLREHRRIDGEESPAAIWQMRRVASTLKELGDLDRAAKLGEEAFLTARRVLGESHPETNVAMANFGNTLWRQGNHETARVLQERAFDALRQRYGMDDDRTLGVATNLALNLTAVGAYDDAQELQKIVIEHRRSTLGDNDRRTLRARLSLASMVEGAGDRPTAETMLAELRLEFLRILGPDHPDTLLATEALASAVFQRGDYEASRELEQLVVDGRLRTLGESHPATEKARSHLASIEAASSDVESGRRWWPWRSKYWPSGRTRRN